MAERCGFTPVFPKKLEKNNYPYHPPFACSNQNKYPNLLTNAQNKRCYPLLLPPESSPHCSFRPIHPTNSYLKRAYYWVDTFAYGGVPSTAIPGGSDIDGHQIYVGRAFHEGDWIPAKVIPGKNVAYIAYGGEEYPKERYQVLCEQRFDWVHCQGGNIPEEAVEGGRTADGEALFIGRVQHEGSDTVGKVHPSHGCCFIPFGGVEIPFTNYEVLVLRK